VMTNGGTGKNGTEWGCVEREHERTKDRALWDAACEETAGGFRILTGCDK